MGFFKEFMDFMKEQKIISVALAFIVGVATAALIQALVKDIISPIYTPYIFTDIHRPKSCINNNRKVGIPNRRFH